MELSIAVECYSYIQIAWVASSCVFHVMWPWLRDYDAFSLVFLLTVINRLICSSSATLLQPSNHHQLVQKLEELPWFRWIICSLILIDNPIDTYLITAIGVLNPQWLSCIYNSCYSSYIYYIYLCIDCKTDIRYSKAFSNVHARLKSTSEDTTALNFLKQVLG